MSIADLKSAKQMWREHLRSRSDLQTDIKIGLTASFTIDPVVPHLGAYLLGEGYSSPEITNADYNQVVQTCLDHGAAFDSNPDVIFVAFRLEDLTSSADPDTTSAAVELVQNALGQLQSKFDGAIVCALPPRPDAATMRLTRFARPDPIIKVWHDMCAALIVRFGSVDGFYFLDLDEIASGLGSAARDERKRLLYRQPFTEDFYFQCGQRLGRIIRARRFESKKCLVLDCDNTLWGGVVGEDGIGGIKIGEDFPGSAFREFQRQAKVLRDSGVFLALNTKNNPGDVLPVFDNHDGMVLRRQDISVAKINWRPKSENLKEIAAELNIGLDALVFVDDNKFEIAEVQAHTPEVTCLLVPEELSELPALLQANAHIWDRLAITDDDRQRVDRMQSELDRRSLAQELTGQDFLAQLELKAFIYSPEAPDLTRVTQLINKTNQFNVTTRRFAQEEVEAFLAKDENRLYCMSVVDKFGAYGLVGVAMVTERGGAWELQNFLMSCRVLGRGVETAFLYRIAEHALESNAAAIKGTFLPTPKNGMVVDFFSRHGFAIVGESAGNGTLWSLELPGSLSKPDYVEIIDFRPA